MTFKLGFYDIEMSPAVVHSWGLFEQNHSINQVMADPYMLSFAWRWYGSKKVEFYSVHKDGREGMVKQLHRLMDEADAVSGWNSIGFDTKHANREFLEFGLTPPSPFKEIDLMMVFRSSFRLLSNKLDYVAQLLGIGKKKSTGGHELWVACMAGDEKAWRTMRSYNIQDVNLLVEIYEKGLPWIKNHPNINLYENSNGCPACGSENFQKRGLAPTGVALYQRYQCQDCGKWFKSGKIVQKSDYRQL